MKTDKIKKILVPLDGSKNSLRGLDMAITLARVSNATITGIYVVYAPSHSEFGRTGSIQKGAYEKIKQFMESAKTKAAQNGIVFNGKILHGDIGYQILSYAQSKKHKFDLIVIGHRGRSTLKEAFLGSTSHYVIHASNIPVLVVK